MPQALFQHEAASVSASMFVVHVVNSTYGRAGQVAYRTQFIKSRLDELGISNLCLARDQGIGRSGVQQVLPLGDTIPRLANAYRMFVNPGFDHRRYDVRLFEHFAAPRLARVLRNVPGSRTVVHLWEFSPALIHLAHRYEARVVLDVPIAPSHETVRLQKQGFVMDTPVNGIDPAEDSALRLADVLLSPSDYVTGVLRRIGIPVGRILTNPYGVVVDAHTRTFRDRADGLTYLFVGTLSKRKGVDYLLRAWQMGGFTNDRLVLCGRTIRSIAALLRRLQLPNVGRPGHVNVQPYLETADVFVLPTLMEGSAKAVFEAMAAGLPVITTPNSGSVVEHGVDGLIVPPGDVDALAAAMRYFKECPEQIRGMGVRAQAKARRYTWQEYADRAIRVYEGVLAVAAD